MEIVEFIRSYTMAQPDLAKFALGMMIIFGVPLLSRRVGLPGIVGLLLSGVVIGPHGLGIFGEERPVVDFLADLGKLLLMFVAGLEIDLAQFRQGKIRQPRTFRPMHWSSWATRPRAGPGGTSTSPVPRSCGRASRSCRRRTRRARTRCAR